MCEVPNQRVKPSHVGQEADLCLAFAEYQLEELEHRTLAKDEKQRVLRKEGVPATSLKPGKATAKGQLASGQSQEIRRPTTREFFLKCKIGPNLGLARKGHLHVHPPGFHSCFGHD